ncbi:hypothetical protein BLSTO_03025 [Blastocystis sp. subtype 1]
MESELKQRVDEYVQANSVKVAPTTQKKEPAKAPKTPKKAEKQPKEAKENAPKEIVEAPKDAPSEKKEVDQKINPWTVEAGEGGVDYDKLINSFGMNHITPELLERFERLTGHKMHRWLRRGMFFCHRDLNLILDAYEKGEKFYLYTGRGPSSGSLHLGHLIPFYFTKWLQDVFDCPLVIQLTDDEKFLWKPLSLDECIRMGRENTKDIIACGFDPKKTFIFSDMSYMGELYRNVVRIQKCITVNTARAIFGFSETSSIGQQAFPAIQASPAFSSSFPKVLGQKMRCLIPCAVDQDPYFRMTRDIAGRLNEHKPAIMCSKFIPALVGLNTKMSASSTNTCIYVTDTPNQIKNKINRHAYSGGRETEEEQRALGADLSKDIPYQYLEYFLEDDEELKRIREEYGSGRMLTGEVKKILIGEVQALIHEFQERRAAVTEEDVDAFYAIRKLEF